jgi:hypothetical protein
VDNNGGTLQLNQAVGNVLIGTTTDNGGKLQVAGYTRLGSDAGAPAIKMKKLTGTTASTQGGIVNVAHGLTPSKILDVQIAVNYSGSGYVPLHHTYSAGYNVDCSWAATNIDVLNVPANSANVLSKPFTIMITYEE